MAEIKQYKSNREPIKTNHLLENIPETKKSNLEPIKTNVSLEDVPESKNLEVKSIKQNKKVRAGNIRMGIRVKNNDSIPNIMKDGCRLK